MFLVARRLPVVLLVLAGCGAGTPPTSPAAARTDSGEPSAGQPVERELLDQHYLVLAGDPAFAAWPSCWQQLRETTSLEVVADEAAWQQFANTHSTKHDAAALALARELVAPDRAAAFAAFAASSVGRSLALAEGRAHALAGSMLEVPTETLATFRNGAEVGDVARERFREVAELMKDGMHSASPSRLALTIASIEISPEQAAAIDAFHRTDDGAAWLAVREAARDRTRGRVVALQGEALECGLVKDRFAGMSLPKFVEPTAPR